MVPAKCCKSDIKALLGDEFVGTTYRSTVTLPVSCAFYIWTCPHPSEYTAFLGGGTLATPFGPSVLFF